MNHTRHRATMLPLCPCWASAMARWRWRAAPCPSARLCPSRDLSTATFRNVRQVHPLASSAPVLSGRCPPPLRIVAKDYV